jgi:hypothetical protein
VIELIGPLRFELLRVDVTPRFWAMMEIELEDRTGWPWLSNNHGQQPRA